jgi:hypothetical protein
VKNFPLPTLIPNQQTLLDATRSIGMTSAVSDSRSNIYDIFIALKKVTNTTTLPTPESSKSK